METKKTAGFLKAREERVERNLTIAQMGEVLGMAHAMLEAGAIEGYEKGMPVNSGAVRRIYEALQRGRLQASVWLGIPRFCIGRLEAEQSWVIHHTEWPRFVGRVFREALHKEQWRFGRAGMPVFEMNPACGFAQAVFSFVDHVPRDFDPEDILSEAVLVLEKKIMEDSRNGD